MTIGIWVLGDQLSAQQAALQSVADQKAPVSVILIESLNHIRERWYHRQKLVLVWSAMRHFAKELRQARWSVTYTEAEDFEPALQTWCQAEGITELRIMQPNDRPFAHMIQTLRLPCPLTLVQNNHFLWSETDFQAWAKTRKRLLMEDFYREGRRRFQVLMEGTKPVGGAWNFDAENRKPPKAGLNPPPPLWFAPDALTQAVIDKVESLDMELYGEAKPFRWGVTRQHALQVLEEFIRDRLPTFGPYEDAMLTAHKTLWHGLLSPYLNLGLLQPLEVVEAAEKAYHDRHLDLNSVEGFIRQVMGWREYMRGIYVSMEDDYPTRNWFNHTQPLPAFYWNAETTMNCLHQVLTQVQEMGYAHHIQRLMVLNNFALIAGISPQAIENWFHAAFIDGYDWVMQPNVIGMGQFADGGIVASKPYAASANYINRMSDYCQGCAYDPRKRTGDRACPFNFFYWDFLARHRDKLKSQGRINLVLANLDKMLTEELQQIRQHAIDWHREQGSGESTS